MGVGSGLVGKGRLYPQRSDADPGLFLRGQEVVEKGAAEKDFTPLFPLRAGRQRAAYSRHFARRYLLERVRLRLGRGSPELAPSTEPFALAN